MREKKILHVLDHSVPYRDGYATRAQQIIINQKAMGFVPIVATSDRHEPEHTENVEEIDGTAYYRSKKNSVFTNSSVLRDLITVKSLSRVLSKVVEKEKPDILHAHSPLLNGYAALRVARKYKLPVVYEIRALWEDAAVDQGKMIEKSPKYNMIRFLETKLAHKVDRVVVIAKQLKKEFIQRGIERKKIFVVPNGVNIDKFKIQEKKNQELMDIFNLKNKIVLGFIGSFYYFEGLEFLVQAFSKINNENIVLMLVGSGERLAYVQQLAQELGINDRVILPGKVDHEDIEKYYSIMDLLVYPRLSRRITELVTPLKPLEAMAMGKCILASDVGGHKELIDGHGIFFKKEDSEDFVQTLQRIVCDDLQSCRQIAIDARQYVSTMRIWKKHVGVYRAVYQGLMDP